MDIPATIDLQKTAILRTIAGLFAMLEGVQARIPLALHRLVARGLKPAESAVRRLIVTLATITKQKAPPSRRKRAAPIGLKRKPPSEDKPLPFSLFDERPRYNRPRRKGPPPRILSLAPGSVLPFLGVRDKRDGKEIAANLLRRLASLKDAIENLPRQVQRLQRAMARRKTIPRLQLQTPLRLGRPPGHRKKPRLEIDRVLHECHWLARNVVAPRDTS